MEAREEKKLRRRWRLSRRLLGWHVDLSADHKSHCCAVYVCGRGVLWSPEGGGGAVDEGYYADDVCV